MTDKTRPRRARPSYSGFFQSNNSDVDSSSSDRGTKGVGTHGDNENALFELESADDDEEGTQDVVEPPLSNKQGLGLRKAHGKKDNHKGHHSESNHALAQGLHTLSPISRSVVPARNIKSKEHRYRPDSLWVSNSDCIQLSQKPSPFTPPSLINSRHPSDSRRARRLRKSWMYSIGYGPCWELFEDKSFFKERHLPNEPRNEAAQQLRPLVYAEFSHDSRKYSRTLLPEQANKYQAKSQSIHCFLGQYNAQTLERIDPFSSLSCSGPANGDLPVLLNAGAAITAADWCPVAAEASLGRKGQQYLAIATCNDSEDSLNIGVKLPSSASIQIWSLHSDHGSEMTIRRPAKCELIMCIDEGVALELKWCPLPSHSKDSAAISKNTRLGLLAAVTANGSANIYVVPRFGKGASGSHHIQHVHVRPLVEMTLFDTTCQALDWANSEVIGIGCSNGFVGVFRVKDAILGTGKAILTHYFPVHQTSIQSLCWARVPPGQADGRLVLAEDPTVLCTTGSEGSVRVADIRDSMSRMLLRNREVPHACVFSAFCGCLVATDVDFSVKLFQLQPTALGMGHAIADLGGTALALSVSDMHPYLAIGSADGSCSTINLLRGTRREGAVPLLNHKIFQLDYSSRTGQYRILDQFYPQENGASEAIVYKESAIRDKSRDKRTVTAEERFEQGDPEPSGLWHPNVAVTVVAWNSGSGLGCAPFLLSGTASGLVRIDYLEGQWIKDTIAYGSAAQRKERGLEEIESEPESD